MPNHLTPEELAESFALHRRDVLEICFEEHVPIYHGKIDRGLFEAVLEQTRPEVLRAAEARVADRAAGTA